MTTQTETRPCGFLSMLKAEPDELRALAWAGLYFFCLLCGYYILRPVRDEMAIQGGVQHLPWMMSATFLVLLTLTPLFGWMAARLPRHVLLPLVYLFFATHLALFYGFMTAGLYPEWIARGFFVWLSVFNLFVVAVFWSYMADLFSNAQGKRLFGVISAGGSLGALVGPSLTAGLVPTIGIPSLMILSAGFLLACVVCIGQLHRWSRERGGLVHIASEAPMGGSMAAGIRLVAASPYLLGICLYLFMLTATATFLYLEQARLVGELIGSAPERTRLFASLDLVVNVLTLGAQIFVTNRLIGRWGLAAALSVLPVASICGFVIFGVEPALWTLLGFVMVRRVLEYAVAKPAREVLFTVVNREEKYKAKNFVDTTVSRAGDAVTGWLLTGAKALGAGAPLIAWVLVPLAAAWGWLGWTLARKQERMKPG
jgi:AAA family ATP:ADP antiporter